MVKFIQYRNLNVEHIKQNAIQYKTKNLLFGKKQEPSLSSNPD